MKIFLNDKLIGTISDVKVDMFHMYGRFDAGDDFALIEPDVDRLEQLWKRAEQDGFTEDEQDELDALTEKLDDLELFAIGKDGHPCEIRDFKVIDGECEFKVV